MLDNSLIESFRPISLEEMGKVRLMNRIDTKFVTSIENVGKLLEIASADYRMQQIGGRSNMPYYTKYFDTSDTLMFSEHQRGKKSRQKIRLRLYEDCGMLPFIEVKSKNNKGRSRKKRVMMEDGTELAPYFTFLENNSDYNPQLLVPHIENHFYRITLVDNAMTERVTIDSCLEFHNLTTGKRISLPEIGIIEWKRDGRNSDSRLGSILRDLHIHPAGFSKYCIGMAATNPGLKQNRLKSKLRMIDKISPIL